MTTAPRYSGTQRPGRFVAVRSLEQGDGGGHVVLITCDGGNLSFQHGMTPDEAREIAGFLMDEANHCELADKEVAA